MQWKWRGSAVQTLSQGPRQPRYLGQDCLFIILYFLSCDNVFVKHLQALAESTGWSFHSKQKYVQALPFPSVVKRKKKKKTGLASFESLEEYPKRWYCNRAELGDLISLGSLFKIPCTHIHPTAQLPTWRSTCSLFSVLETEFRIKTVWLKFMIDFHISVETKDFTNMPTVLLCAFLNTF